MKRIIDISVPLTPDIPMWPDSPGFRLSRTKALEAGDDATVSLLECDVHTGTHIDAPAHFVRNGDTIDRLDLDSLIGPAYVAHLPDIRIVTPHDLEGLNLSPDISRLLLRTRNSRLWARRETEFRKDFTALTSDGARWIAEKGMKLIGIDYLSIQRFGDGPQTHQTLLEAGVIILEGLNLWDVSPGMYELICLPLNLAGAEGAPARAVLRSDA